MSADHALVFLGVEMDGWCHLSEMTIRGEVIPASSYIGHEQPCAWAVCSCGEWRSDLLVHRWLSEDNALAHAEDDHARHVASARREAEEAALTDAACLYCFKPLDKPGYCSDAHRAADRVRVPADVREAVLAEFSEDFTPGPDQIAMF